MAYASGQITGSANPAADLMTQIHTVITGHASWSYFTTEFTSGSYTARVYKNAAAGNPAGVDFYVAVFRLTATPASNVYIVAMEGWDGTNKYPIRFCPGPTTNFAPDATYFGHPNTTTVFGSAALNYNVSAPTNTTNFPYYIIVSTSGLFVTTGNTNAPYAGLFEPWWGSATSAEYPLVTVDYAFSSTYSSFSRVPTYTNAVASRAAAAVEAWGTARGTINSSLLTGFGGGVTGRAMGVRYAIRENASTVTRGLLPHVGGWNTAASGINLGDTMTVNGQTWWYTGQSAASIGCWVNRDAA